MQNKKSTSGRKLKICKNLLICFICIMLSCGNVFGSSNLAENGGNTVITEFDMPETEASVNIGTDKTDVSMSEKTTATSEDGKKDAVVTVKPNVEPLAEPDRQEKNASPIIAVPFTSDQTPVIDPTILSNSAYKVVVINEADGVQTGYSTLQAVMQAIGANSGTYTVVFILNYTITTADKAAVTANGANAQLTITSKYINASNKTVNRSLKSATVRTALWICNGDTTFKDITLSTYLNIYGNCNKLIIGTGVICGSDRGYIYGGGNATKTGDADVTILSGRWRIVTSGCSSGTMTGNASMNISGTAVISDSISAAAGVTGKVTVNVDGSYGATVQTFSSNTAADEFNIKLNNAVIISNLDLGNANLDITGTCTVGSSITASTTAVRTIKLNKGASLANGTKGSFNCPNAKLVFGANSKLTCTGTGTICSVANIVIEGDGAALDVKKGNPMTVSGTCAGRHKLNVSFIDNLTPRSFDKLLTFTTRANANKDNYAYPNTNGYDGVVTVNGSVVYFDFVPPEGYVSDWYSSGSIDVGGHDVTVNVDDLKCQFWPTIAKMDDTAFRLYAGQLTAKINRYKPPSGAVGTAFTNYFYGTSPNCYYTIKVESVVYILTGSKDFHDSTTPSSAFRGYKRSKDGSNLDLVFYLGKNVGIVYLHLAINPKSLVMSESWDYVNLSKSVQRVLMSHGNDITYAGDDKSYCISSPGKDIAFAFQTPSDPAMFMWVDQFTTDNPAAAGNWSTGFSQPNICKLVRTGKPFPDTTPITWTSLNGSVIDTEMGIQWRYDVPAGKTQSVSGGTAFGNPGNLQITGKEITFHNPDKEDNTKTIKHNAINVSNSSILFTAADWKVSGLPDGITVTGIPASVTIPPRGGTTELVLTYSADFLVPPGIYPVKYTMTSGTATYTFTDQITVIRDEIELSAAVMGEDNIENTSAISGITTEATSPVTGATIYKYYDGKLSRKLDSSNYEIKKITAGGAELTEIELIRAKVNNYLTFDKMEKNEDVVIYVGKPARGPTNRVTVSKTVVGGVAGQTFVFTITVKDGDGAALEDETKLYCLGGIIKGSEATAPAITTLTLDANGQAAFKLTHGQRLEIIGIPAEGKIQVDETAVTGYEATHTIDGVASAAVDQKTTGSINMDNTDKSITFCNTRVYDLTVSKTVKGEFSDKMKTFSFNIYVKDAKGNNTTRELICAGGVLTGTAYAGVTAPEIETLSISSGLGSFTLKHGQFITIKNLDPTYKIQVTEVDPGSIYTTKHIKGGTWIDSREVSEFTLGTENAAIGYTNTRVLEPITGIKESSNTWLPVMAVVLLWCVALGYGAYRRRKAR